MPTILKLEKPLTQKEQKMFKIPNELSLDNFSGYQYAMCLCGIQKGIDGKYKYNPAYSKNYIGTEITPNKIIKNVNNFFGLFLVIILNNEFKNPDL